MRRAFSDLSKKEKLYFVILLVLGYLSPILGIGAWLFVKGRTEKKILKYAPLAGAALALLVYIGDYMYLLWA